MGRPLKQITIRGFKSIRALEEFELHSLNILICGKNGAGKSNFVSFFKLLREIIDGHLQLAVAKSGGADAQLFLGPKITPRISAVLEFGMNSYSFQLDPTVDNRLVFSDERIGFEGRLTVDRSLGSGHDESRVANAVKHGPQPNVAEYIFTTLSDWVVYHFHDTSDSAGVRRGVTIRDNDRLRPDASNLAAFLLMLSTDHPENYTLILDTIRLVAPFFDSFRLKPRPVGDDQEVLLEWSQIGSDFPFHPTQLSDGTLRFICLATALLQPDPPTTILLDEPELGLHPYALGILASLLKKTATSTQVIVSTQSAPLLDQFDAEDVIVVNRKDASSEFARLSQPELETWLETYSLGELWQKNYVEAGPTNG